MNNHLIKFSVLVSVIFLSACNTDKSNTKEDDSLNEENFYLGQDPPGLIPEVFAPGMVTTNGWEYGGVFTPDLKEFYFIREVIDDEGNSTQQFVLFQNNNGEWQDSVISARIGQPIISSDGKTMHLGRRYKERTASGWSELELLDPPFSELRIMRLSSSTNGTYYFDTYDPDNVAFPIRYSRLIDGKYEEPRPLGENINSGTFISHPFIAQDESYLIWDAKREGGYGDSDLYISFRKKDGSWGDAINLGDKINTGAWEAAATITPDGKYLFFNRNIGSGDFENVDIFWVSTDVINNLRPQ